MNEKTKILLVEDDVNLGSLLKQYLNAKGYQTDLATDGKKGFDLFMKDQFHLCLLDVMIPEKDGFSLAEDIRKVNAQVPIIFLTAKNMKEDVIEGFRLGGDDYMTKPFNMEELVSRIEAVLRRSSKKPVDLQMFNLGRFIFDVLRQQLILGEKIIKLTTKESELLRLLCMNANQVLDRTFALKAIWLDDSYFNARSMDVYITKLRKHLSEEQGIEIINVHGKGYKLLITNTSDSE